MINYIFELFSFIAAVIMYAKDDTKAMAIWIAASVCFGFAASVVDIFLIKKRTKEENK